MKILMVDYEYPPLGGGGGVFNKQLAEELGKAHRITVVTTRFGNQPAHETVNNVELIRAPVPMRSDPNAATIISMLSFFPSSLWTALRCLRGRSFDIVHSFFAIPSAPSGWVFSKAMGKPHLLSILGGDIYDPSKKLSPHKTPVLYQTVKTMLNGADKIISLSTDIRRRARDLYAIDNPIDVIHLGIPEPRIDRRSRAHFGFGDDDVLLVTVGRLIARKSNAELIEGLARMPMPHVKLAVVGDGPQRAALESLANELGVSNRVRFLGNINDQDKFACLASADIYVSSSHHEGFGIVFLEAMAAGLPVVSYDNGGQADFLIDGQTGSLVPVGQRSALFRQIRELCEHRQRREETGAHNRQYVRGFFIETCAQRYLTQYQSLLRK